eukprot:scaffold72818_cov57-Phaeocystis_antarctica.AAC.4
MCSGVRHRLHVLLSTRSTRRPTQIECGTSRSWQKSRATCVCAGAWGWCAVESVFSRHSCVLSLLPLFYKAPDQRGTEASDDDDDDEEKYTEKLGAS